MFLLRDYALAERRDVRTKQPIKLHAAIHHYPFGTTSIKMRLPSYMVTQFAADMRLRIKWGCPYEAANRIRWI